MRKLAVWLIVMLIAALAMSVVGCGGPEEGTAEWYLDRGNELAEEGRYEEAIEEYTKAIEIDPDYAAAYNNRGYAYDELGEYQQAIDDYTKAIEIDPDCADTYNNRGYTYRELGYGAEALADYEKVITLTDDPKLIEWAREAIEELSE